MTISDIVPFITALAALIGAIAAAFWGRGLANAKDEIIKSKDAQLEALRSTHEKVLEAKQIQIETLQMEVTLYKELISTKPREYFLDTKEQLEDIIKRLEQDIKSAELQIAEKDKKIEELSYLGGFTAPSFGSALELKQKGKKKEADERMKKEEEEQKEKLRQRVLLLDMKMKAAEDRADLETAQRALDLLKKMKTLQDEDKKIDRHVVCQNCGMKNYNSSFCANCGYPLK